MMIRRLRGRCAKYFTFFSSLPSLLRLPVQGLSCRFSSDWHSPPPHHHNHDQDNGYSDLLVGISPDVPESPEMLDQLKQILTNASASLYTATR